MNPYWSYLLTAVGVFGLWVVGRKDKRGFMIGLGAQVLWFAYAVTTRQWGFIVSCLAYGWINWKNLRAWRKADGLQGAQPVDREGAREGERRP